MLTDSTKQKIITYLKDSDKKHSWWNKAIITCEPTVVIILYLLRVSRAICMLKASR